MSKLLEAEFNDFLVTMRLVHAVHGKSSRAVRYTAKQLSKRFIHNDVIALCKKLSTDYLAYDNYLTIERRIENEVEVMHELKVIDAVKKIKFKRSGFYAQDANMMIHRFKNTPTFNGGTWTDNLSSDKKYMGIAYLCDDYAETVVFGDSRSLIEVKQKSEFIGG